MVLGDDVPLLSILWVALFVCMSMKVIDIQLLVFSYLGNWFILYMRFPYPRILQSSAMQE